MEQEFTLRRRGVHLLGQRAEGDASFLEAGHRRQQVGQRPAETVELPNHQTIARLEEDQGLREAGAVAATATGTVFE